MSNVTPNGMSQVTTPKHKRVKIIPEKTSPRRVDFFHEHEDFLCVMLASLGLYTDAIVALTGLTSGQVNYRLRKSDPNRIKGNPTERVKYRRGESDIVRAIVGDVVSPRSKSGVKKLVAQGLDKKGLYTPNTPAARLPPKG